MSAVPVPFADLLRSHRLAAGLTQEALAERAGLSARGVQNLERAVRRPYPDTLERLAAALGLMAEERAKFLAAGRAAPRSASGRAGGGPAGTLPSPLTTFIGRGQELADLHALLAGHRLVTVTGPGGIGKTRLALQVAAALAERSPDGVRLVELAALADARLVAQAVAVGVGVREERDRPLSVTLAEALRQRRLLLVLDNCEHLVEACATLAAALLGACSELRVLATSREPLGLPGEALYRVLPLALPEPGSLRAEALLRSDAVRLFVDRASTVQPHFALADDNAAAVARLCRRLDGIPLALELAAGRLGGLPVEELAARLEEGFRLLAGGSRVALPRQQTLWATLHWSYDLLRERERALFQQLSVFAGGWTLEAAEAVGAGDGLAREEVLDLLLRLVDQSLVLAEEQPEGTARYRLLEPLRQYGRERLAAGGHAEAAYERHAAYYLALAEEAEPHLLAADANAWQRRLEAEHDNVRGALQHWLGREEAERGLRLAIALQQYWYLHGYLAEAHGWVRDLLALPTAGNQTRGRATGLVHLGHWAGMRGEKAASEAVTQEGIAIFRALGDEGGIAAGLHRLGFLAWEYGEYDEARRCIAESLAIRRRLGDAAQIMSSLCWLGRVTNYAGQPAAARLYLEECLALAMQMGSQRMIALATEFLGEVAGNEEDDAEAAMRFAAALALYEASGDKAGIGTVNTYLGRVALQRGDIEEARQHFRTGLRVANEIGYRKRLCDALEGLAALAATDGRAERAYRLLGAAAALREASRELAAPHERAWLARRLAPARAALGERAATVEAEGRAMTPEDAVAYAREDEVA